MTHYAGSLEFDVVELSEHHARGKMVISDGMLNPFGTVHAGALLWFADVIATTLALGEQSAEPGMTGFPLAIAVNAQLLGNERSGELTAQARFVKKGRRMQVVRTEVVSSDSKVLVDVTTTHISS